jgi:hypothetical protein
LNGILFFNETVRRKNVVGFPFVIFLMLAVAYSSHIYAQKKQGKMSKQNIKTDMNIINLPAKTYLPGIGGQGLEPMNNGQIVYDKTQNIYWLADANLAGDQKQRQLLAPKLNINPDGSMDYQTALDWVAALNNYQGKGYLGHKNWQLPVTPAYDPSCFSKNVNNFGANCTGSALGNLYKVGIGQVFPNSVVSYFSATIPPLLNVQPSMYWTLDKSKGGQQTFSFLTDTIASNTTDFNYMHVLATMKGSIGQPPSGNGIIPYTSGPAAGKAVYDSHENRTWLLDANLARTNSFEINGTTTITSKSNGKTISVPLIDNDGAMLFKTATDPSIGWIAAMNKKNYAGANMKGVPGWELPHYNDLQTLFNDLKLKSHDIRLVNMGNEGSFHHLQPFFYWACQRDQNGNSQSPCNSDLNPPPNPGGGPMAWSFNLDNGFEGTSSQYKPFYVMVYYPMEIYLQPPIKESQNQGNLDVPQTKKKPKKGGPQ